MFSEEAGTAIFGAEGTATVGWSRGTCFAAAASGSSLSREMFRSGEMSKTCPAPVPGSMAPSSSALSPGETPSSIPGSFFGVCKASSSSIMAIIAGNHQYRFLNSLLGGRPAPGGLGVSSFLEKKSALACFMDRLMRPFSSISFTTTGTLSPSLT